MKNSNFFPTFDSNIEEKVVAEYWRVAAAASYVSIFYLFI